MGPFLQTFLDFQDLPQDPYNFRLTDMVGEATKQQQKHCYTRGLISPSWTSFVANNPIQDWCTSIHIAWAKFDDIKKLKT